jgi:hypothetical protein
MALFMSAFMIQTPGKFGIQNFGKIRRFARRKAGGFVV